METDASKVAGEQFAERQRQGTLVASGKMSPHQLPGASGGGLHNEVLPEGSIQCSRSVENGQSNGSGIYKQDGGTHSQCLMDQACHLWEWCLHKGITVSAEYLPGQENWIADKESQWIQTAVEWKLHGKVFSLIQKVLGPCQIDLFASRLNNQLRDYVHSSSAGIIS